MSDTMFSKHGDKWVRIELGEQCGADVFLGLDGACQGVKGHKGVHWCYSPAGDFCYEDNDDDTSEDGCSGKIPAGHASYPTPERMSRQHFMAFRTTTVVTDPAEIERLERGDMEEGECHTRPMNDDPFFDDIGEEKAKEIEEAYQKVVANIRARKERGVTGPKLGDDAPEDSN